MKYFVLLVFSCGFLYTNIHAQNDDTIQKFQFELGPELQGYPTGLIAGLRLELVLREKHGIHIRSGYNWFNHRSLGKHDSESGGGGGFSIGYRRYFKPEGLKGFLVGARTDLWWNQVDWAEHQDNDRNMAKLYGGKTRITVLQPTLEVGYRIETKNDKAAFVPSIAFGMEWNIQTTAEVLPIAGGMLPDDVNLNPETGEGFIILAGFSFVFPTMK